MKRFINKPLPKTRLESMKNGLSCNFEAEQPDPEKLIKIFEDIAEEKEKTSTNHNHCEYCYWFESFNGDIDFIHSGACHRYPKTIYKEYDDWCGEFKERR